MPRNTSFVRAYERDGETTVLSTDAARQGVTTGRMRRVLGNSLILALVAGATILAFPWIELHTP